MLPIGLEIIPLIQCALEFRRHLQSAHWLEQALKAEKSLEIKPDNSIALMNLRLSIKTWANLMKLLPILINP